MASHGADGLGHPGSTSEGGQLDAPKEGAFIDASAARTSYGRDNGHLPLSDSPDHYLCC